MRNTSGGKNILLRKTDNNSKPFTKKKENQNKDNFKK